MSGQAVSNQQRWQIAALFTPARRVIAPLVVLAALMVLTNLFLEYHWGESGWKQGDWLIHTLNGHVRRGPLGSLLIWSADRLGVSPLHLVIVLQAALTVVVFALLLKLWWHLPAPLWLWLAMPAGFPIFWACAPNGSLRKEVLAYIALLIVALSRHLGGALLGLLVFAFAVIGHEGMLVLTPALALLLWYGQPQYRGWLLALLGLIALGGASYALTFHTATDATAICASLLERGLRPRICTGAIEWVGRSRADSFAQLPILTKGMVLPLFALACVITAITCWLMVRHLAWQQRSILALGVLPIFLLFPMAIDWGRWLSLSFSTLMILVAAFVQWQRIPPPPLPRFAGLWMLSSLLWGIHYGIGMRRGFLVNLYDIARHALPG